ncbi:peptidoglycan recognition protein family protein [Streptomyces colonosanans]|uniref:N-acetylmuramoyl-L-alanine amidase n=1 Tax=Streptomyces colonosanans TaxID=1428652 RepID=A0A1S2P8X7_9ACTN|nr:peptidoglycan recognition protein [Streptomyces colonosanans]OIJ90158.1 N-acetylmuramoyl-L-alanine amidase [Streptomyces colonosanans]
MSKIMVMRKYLASSIGFTCAAALTLSLTLPAAAAGPVPADRSAIPGSTQSLRLVPLTSARTPGAAPEWGLAPQSVRTFSMIGVVWDDPGAELHGRAQIRTRASGTARWSGWQELEVHNDGHGPDRKTKEGRSNRLRGSTAPLWVGDSNGVEVRVRADETRAPALPDGLRVELIDPGAEPAKGAPEQSRDAAASEESEGGDLSGSLPGTDTTTSAVGDGSAPVNDRQLPALSKGVTASRPRIITRRGWGADESLREPGFVYTDKVKVAFVHHTATGNGYSCSQASSVIRGIYRYHVVSSGWRDIGYNFLVDRCGDIYEGRAGGADKPVLGAHTLGFNDSSMGVAAIGSFEDSTPSAAMVTSIARLAAWKLGLYGMDPRGKTYLRSGGGNRYPEGENARLNVISGHRDGYSTDCPGTLLYGKLGSVRSAAARYQGR